MSAKSFATMGQGALDLNMDMFKKPATKQSEAPVNLATTAPQTNPMDQLSQAFQANPQINLTQTTTAPSNPLEQISQTLQQSGSNSQPNAADFSTLQMMFQTTNYADLQNQGSTISANGPSASQLSQLSQTAPPPPSEATKPNPMDIFNNNMPANFSTMSGAGQSSAIDMSAFGTMQAGQKGGNINVDFLQSMPPPTKKQSEGDLI